jgi:hypothetical protein
LGRTCTGWIAPALPGAFTHSITVGDGEQPRRNGEAERRRGDQVHDEIELGRLLHRQVLDVRATKNAIDICGRALADELVNLRVNVIATLGAAAAPVADSRQASPKVA